MKILKSIYSDYAKALSESKADVKMFEYGCNELKSAYICRDLRDMYKNLGDREKTKEYNDKIKNGDENRILFAMIISILDIFIKTPLYGGF